VGAAVHRYKTGACKRRHVTPPPHFYVGFIYLAWDASAGKFYPSYLDSLNNPSEVNRTLGSLFPEQQSLSVLAAHYAKTACTLKSYLLAFTLKRRLTHIPKPEEASFHSTHFKCHPVLGGKDHNPGNSIRQHVLLTLEVKEN
jgi:hypothetical protein